MQDQVRIGRVIALLEEVKGELDTAHIVGRGPRSLRMYTARLHDKITQAQNLLVGADPTRPEDN